MFDGACIYAKVEGITDSYVSEARDRLALRLGRWHKEILDMDGAELENALGRLASGKTEDLSVVASSVRTLLDALREIRREAKRAQKAIDDLVMPPD